MEYPKMLYKGEPTSQEHLNWLVSIPHEALARVVVASQEAEDALRKEGYKALHEFEFLAAEVVAAVEEVASEAEHVAEEVVQAVEREVD